MTGLSDFLAQVLDSMGHRTPTPIRAESRLEDDLDLDSLDLLEVIVAIEDHYQVTVDVDRLVTGPITVATLAACAGRNP